MNKNLVFNEFKKLHSNDILLLSSYNNEFNVYAKEYLNMEGGYSNTYMNKYKLNIEIKLSSIDLDSQDQLIDYNVNYPEKEIINWYNTCIFYDDEDNDSNMINDIVPDVKVNNINVKKINNDSFRIELTFSTSDTIENLNDNKGYINIVKTIVDIITNPDDSGSNTIYIDGKRRQIYGNVISHMLISL